MTPVNPERVTLGEVGRNLSEFKTHVETRFTELGTHVETRFSEIAALITGMHYIHPDTYRADQRTVDTKHAEQDRRITALEDQNTWLWRTVVGLILALVVGGLIGTR